jgi:hypothetical protein
MEVKKEPKIRMAATFYRRKTGFNEKKIPSFCRLP